MAAFKLDENLPVEAAELLRSSGHDAMTVLEQQLGGHVDGDIAAHCLGEQRTIVTFDLDFGDIRAYPPADYFGIIVLRLKSQAKPQVLKVIQQIIPLFAVENLIGKLWIVNEQTIRIRE